MSRIGGLPRDLPPDWITQCLEVVHDLHRKVDQLERTLTNSTVWMDKTKNCIVPAHDAIEWGYTGPCLRASGIKFDIRKDRPYYFYSDVKFEVPLGINGDTYDRYLVRVEEIRQSLAIIFQVLDFLPIGDYFIDDRQLGVPKDQLEQTGRGGRMSSSLFLSKGPELAPGEFYSASEAANGELGFFIVSDGENHPYRVKVRAPSFAAFQSFSKMVEGESLNNALVFLNSLNIVAGELDR